MTVGRLVFATSVLGLLGAACQQGDEHRPGPPSPPPTSASTRVGDVVWPAAASIHARARAALSATALEAVARSGVPVLVPGDDDLIGVRSTLVVKDGWYTMSVHGAGFSVVVTGSRVARVYPGVGPAPGRDRVRGAAAHVTRNEGIHAASWTEHGAQYSIELECDDPRSEACATDAKLRALADGLVYVGGAGEGGAP